MTNFIEEFYNNNLYHQMVDGIPQSTHGRFCLEQLHPFCRLF